MKIEKNWLHLNISNILFLYIVKNYFFAQLENYMGSNVTGLLVSLLMCTDMYYLFYWIITIHI